MIIKEIRLTRTRPNPNTPAGKPWKDAAYGVVRDGCYGSGLDKFDAFFEEARQTFPWLTKAQAKVSHYGGDYYAGTFGIEFEIPYDIFAAPEGWEEIPELEYTR